MHAWLNDCENWLVKQYKDVLGVDIPHNNIVFHWLSAESLSNKVERNDAQNMVVVDGFYFCFLLSQNLLIIR